ncbi:hypothetical protein [Miltoncostaea oceani]|uniref:hypothetical protein n=1 Tax=Miltoncostaea oceani TaxID=2843216 RepID=UPI001C3E76BD|nr:hypothetical protein [Miltoncostaea oceani]
MFAALSLLLGGIALTVGCGDDDSSADVPPPPPTTQTRVPDAGCTESTPKRIEWNPPEAGVYVVGCSTDGGGQVVLTSTTAQVLRVWSPSGGQVDSYPPPSGDASALAVASVIPTSPLPNGSTPLLPGGSASIFGTAPVTVTFEADPALTHEAAVAAAFASWAQGKLAQPGRRLAIGAAACADASSQVLQTQSYLEDSIRASFGIFECTDFVRAIQREVGDAAPPASVLDDVLSTGRRVIGPSFRDEVIRVLYRLAS